MVAKSFWCISTLFATHPAVIGISIGNKMDLFNCFSDKFSKELRCLNIIVSLDYQIR